MAEYTQREGSGSLFVNDRKEKETHADLTGTMMINGVEYYLSAWRKETSAGRKFLSVSIKEKNPIPKAEVKGYAHDELPI